MVWPAAVLVLAFAILVWPVVLGSEGRLSGEGGRIKYPVNELGDQRKYHEPVIDRMVRQWPRIDITNHASATAPGYHLMMAYVARFVSDRRAVVQLASSVLSLGLLLVVWSYAAREVGSWRALALVLPVLGSSYVLGAAIWLTTDNAALFFVCLVLGGAAFGPARPTALLRGGLAAACAVFIRQIHIWVVAPLGLVALLASPLGRWAPPVLREPDEARSSWRPLVAGGLAVAAPLALLVVFVILWGGLTPPVYADLHDAGTNPASFAVALALVGLFGVFFLPALVAKESWMRWDRAATIAVGIALLLSLAVPTAYDFEAGRRGGAIWELVRRMPVVADRSLVLPPLAALGALILLWGWRGACRRGRGRQASILVLAMAAWLLAQSVNTQAWQRYFEPMILIALAWLAALAAPRPDPCGHPILRRWWLGPVALGVIQLALSTVTLYAPLLRWQPPS